MDRVLWHHLGGDEYAQRTSWSSLAATSWYAGHSPHLMQLLKLIWRALLLVRRQRGAPLAIR